jgi:hypothetical protein
MGSALSLQMLTRNPKTGAIIRVLKSEASCWKNRKTLVWLNKVSGPHIDRWDTAWVGLEGLEKLSAMPTMLFLLEATAETQAWLRTPAAKEARFLFVTNALVEAIGVETFGSLGLGNVLCLEELNTMYPFLGAVWNGTSEDAIIVAALIFRYSRIVGIAGSERPTSMPLEANLDFVESGIAPEPLALITQFYKPAQNRRAKELTKCLKKNLENPLIDKIVLFVDSDDIVLPADPTGKIQRVPLKSRITYYDCLVAARDILGPGWICAAANTDIYLDEATWGQVWSVNLDDTLLALLRYEESVDGSSPPQLFGPRADSQDCWVFTSDSVLKRTLKPEAFQIPFGIAGCDNAILVEFLRAKYNIVNPAMSLKTIHVHKSEIRTYDPLAIVDRPVYMHVDPSGFHELNPNQSWKGWAGKAIAHATLDRPLKATTEKMLGTWTAQMNRDPSYAWSASGYNAYSAPADQDHPIEITGGAFVAPSGLVFKHTELCVGSTELQKQLWSDNRLSHLIPAQATTAMMAFPLEPAWLDTPGLYVLNYLSRILAAHQTTPEASFWCKQTAPLLAAFKLFKWKEPRGHLLHYGSQTQAFAQKVVGRTCHGVRILPADIQALRENLFGGWEATPADAGKKVVFVGDELHLKGSLLEALEAAATAAGLETRVIFAGAQADVWAEALSGAGRVVLSTFSKLKHQPWSWLWLAPAGCEVLELQEDREPSDNLVHLAAAAGLSWTLLLYPRSTQAGFEKFIHSEFQKWLEATAKNSQDLSNSVSKLPAIFVPPKTMKFGFFGHSGDSFREMVELWAEKGFVERKEDPILTQIWLGGVGQTLLYDRPTWNWFLKAPEAEKTFTKCLVGNPAPGDLDAGPDNVYSWTFWPRRPRLVEEAVGRGLSVAGYDKRTLDLVFYGRVENETQGAFRQDVSEWSEACSEFDMPIGAKAPYRYSPVEYLEKLAAARYGLCLRGFGSKCNREIELLAMGCVPVVTPGIDISNYAEPLLDGVHVLCVRDAEDAKAKMAAITPDVWKQMSEAGHDWWRRNASAEGSWNLTTRLAGLSS